MTKLLLIDDDWTNLETLEKACQFLGHQAILCDSGNQAHAMAIDHRPDLILLDLHLRDLDGMGVFRILRQYPETDHIPVVFISAGPLEVDWDTMTLAGVTDYLSKPVSLDQLQAMINKYAL